MKYFLIAFGLLVSLTGFLYGAKEQKIGYVDTKYIIENYRTAADAQSAFDAEIDRFNNIADSLKNLYEQARDDLEAQRLMLSEAAISAKQIEINQLKKNYDDYIAEVWGKGGKYELKNRELIAPIVQRIKSVITQIATKEGFTIILDAAETKIVYADANLDLTDIILNELNKEYTATIIPPPTVTPQKDLNIGVFPFFNENQAAQENHVGDAIRTAVFDLIRSAPKVRMLSNADINSALLTRNIQITDQINDMDAFSIGLMLQADYIVIGSCSQQGNKISYSVQVLEPLANQMIYEGSGEASRIEEIKQALGNQVQQAIKKISPAEK
jgi:outer membrane protein